MSGGEGLGVAIDAPILPGTAGGVAQFVAGLISALGKLDDGSETYTIVVGSQEQLDWLKRYGGPNQRFVLRAPLPAPHDAAPADNGVAFPGLLKRALGPLLPAARHVQRLLSVPVPSVPPVPPRLWPEVPLSDGFYESLGCDVIHIPTQNFVLCALPTIFNPHDLQHLHYPQFFSPAVIAERETTYTAGCHYAQTVAVGSQWVKDDIVRQYRIAPEKVQVIPEGPPTELYAEPSEDFLATVKQQYRLEQPFALYPAVTWPHKNHLRLLEALALLRDKRGLVVRLVCTGSLFEEFWPRVEKCVYDLKLSQQVKFLGFIPEGDLRALYRLSHFLIEPTLFEACGSPIFEAWLEGVPVACSNATALPEQVTDAALLFEPREVEAIAAAIEKIATDSELRRQLRERGYSRLKDFDWRRTARAYRALYRRAAGHSLTEEDRRLLAWNWMTEPRREAEREQ
jgi:glycosyltransferase involved in cell wall biosynthesis